MIKRNINSRNYTNIIVHISIIVHVSFSLLLKVSNIKKCLRIEGHEVIFVKLLQCTRIMFPIFISFHGNPMDSFVDPVTYFISLSKEQKQYVKEVKL